MNNVIDFIQVNRDRYLDELKALLAIPSISALPEHSGDVRRCAEWCGDEMRRIGLNNVELIATPGNPVVLRRMARSAGGADHPVLRPLRRAAGRSAEPVESPPFEATVRDGEIYARGAADDKGQVFMHLKAIEAHLKQNGRLPVEHQGDPRGRRRSWQRQPRRVRSRPQGRACRRRRGHLRLADVRPRRPVDLLRPARPWRISRSICAAVQVRPALGLVRRRGGQSRRLCWRR